MSPTPIKAAILPVTPYQQNCSLVWCVRTRRGAVIDPGGEVEFGGNRVQHRWLSKW